MSMASLLRERRVALGFSQESLAEATGVSARSISRWEQGRAVPQPEVRRRLAEVLGSDVTEFSRAARSPASDDSQQTPTVWHVPIRRNSFFTGREALLQELHAALQPDGPAPRVQALTGLAGIGKTQAALEYAYRFANSYRAVVWVSADTPAGAVAGFGELATILALPVRSGRHFKHALAAVREWLRQHSGWLVILDNLDDPQILDQIALVGRGSVLITTRAQATGAIGGCFEVPPLSSDEGATFLLRRSKIERADGLLSTTDRAAARTLVTQLGGLPLALDQAAGYLEETGCGLDVYLERFGTQKQLLLGRRGRLARDHPESVETTLALAYRRVARLNPAAGELLCLCAFLHPDLIPEEVLAPAAADPIQLDEALADLATLSLVGRDSRSRGVTVHRLVQDVVRSTLTEEEQYGWAERAVSVIARALPGSDPFHFSRFLRFVPQAQTGVELVSRWHVRTADTARILDRMGAHHQISGDYSASLRLLNEAWRLRKQHLGRNHLETAETVLHVAELALALGHFRRAETLARAAVQQLESQLESMDLRVAQARGFLAHVCTERGMYHEAELLVRSALDAQVKRLGGAHPSVAETLSLLAEVAFMRGRYPETEQLLRQALDINEAGLGADHLVTGLTVEALGTLYRYWGRDREATAELERAHVILRAALGPDHPTLMTVLNGLARAKLSEGHTCEAEALARRALDVREAALGANHPKLAYSLQVLSEILIAQGRYAEAEPLAQRGLAIRNRIHGDRHPTVSISVEILARIREHQGNPTGAMKLYLRALMILRDTAGPEHPRLAAIAQHYARVRESVDRHPAAAARRVRRKGTQADSQKA
jgi:transcriptional regulator with XRE-family HTH domain/tetratricopeptide (TPR) repeat protein